MSAQAGILYKDRRPIEPELVSTLADSIQSAGPHGGGHFTGAGIAMVYQAVHFDDLAALETQPGILPDGRVLTWDGRLDNRNDLLRQFGRTIQGPPTDLAIVAKAIERWSLDALERLIGDWSLALWDPRDAELVLARDYMGNRPLFYTQRDGCVIWSTCLPAIVDLLDLHDDIDEAYVAGYLTFGAPPYHTFYREVRHVPASHLVRVSRRHTVIVARYRDLPLSTLRYQDPRDYEAHFRDLFENAVRVRLRSNGDIWAELSGGYDSSSIVCMWHHLASTGARIPIVLPISMVFPDSPESDETRHIRVVEQWIGRESFKVARLTRRETSALQSSPALLQAEADAPRSVDEALRKMNIHTLLSGELGDLVMAKGTANVSALLDHLKRLQLHPFVSGLLQFSRRRRQPWYHTAGSVFEPLLPPALAQRRRRRRILRSAAVDGLSNNGSISDVFGLAPSFVARTHPEPSRMPDRLYRFEYTKRSLAQGLYLFQQMNWLGNSGGASVVRRTYPFGHRPLVDFTLAVPQSVLWEPASVRAFMRRALTGIVPDTILQRGDKGYASPAVARLTKPAIQAMLTVPVEQWEVCERGYFEPQTLHRLIGSTGRGGSICGSGRLQPIMALETWLRTRRSGGLEDRAAS